MDDEEETYRLWKIRKTIMQVTLVSFYLPANLAWWTSAVGNMALVQLVVKLG